MNNTIRTVALLHVLVYAGIMWFGWQSYKLLRKRSWLYMGIGFFLLLLNRAERFVALLDMPEPLSIRATVLPFTGACFIIFAFWKLSYEHKRLIEKLKQVIEPDSGSQPVEFWRKEFRRAVRDTMKPEYLKEEV